MTFWLLAAPLMAAVLVILLRPLFRQSSDAGINAQDVYKAQLAEIERERSAGLITEGDADAARTEIARRVLRSDGPPSPIKSAGGDPRILAISVAGFVVLATLGLYLGLGRPGLPSQPIAARDLTAESEARLGPAAAELERRLAELDDPADRALLLGDAFASLGGIDEAEEAYLNAYSHRSDDPDILTRLAEVHIIRAQGQVTGEALGFVEGALAFAADHPAANFYRALYDYQQAAYEPALSRLRALLDIAPEGADWTAQISQLIAEVEAELAQVSLLEEMDEGERDAMVRGMVDRLAERLEAEPDDFEGWLRLANAQAVLGDLEAAEASLSRARTLAEGEPLLGQRVQEVADQIGQIPAE